MVFLKLLRKVNFRFLILGLVLAVTTLGFGDRKVSYLGEYREFEPVNLDSRVIKLQKFFSSRNSPLTQYAPAFIEEADKYGLDWRLIPAITGVESSFGVYIPFGSYNAYGWANGKKVFNDWHESISVVSYVLANNYVKRGADTVEKMSGIYNPVTPVEWSQKVKGFMTTIANYPPNTTEVLLLDLDI